MFEFPKWTNSLRPVLGALLVLGPAYVVVLLALGGSPQATAVGYQPPQPVPYSHALHAGKLGIDCRYCHTTVEVAAHAAVPPTQTCMNCHAKIRAESPKLIPVRESYATGLPVPWVRVHDLPDYVYFKDRDSRYLRISKTLADYLGLGDHVEAIGKNALAEVTPAGACHGHEHEHEHAT